MKAYHIKRLLKLADHLEHGKRLHKKFDFTEIASGNPKVKCNTAGCALGELPAVFPKQFKLMKDRRMTRYEVVYAQCKVVPHMHRYRHSYLIAERFFGITSLHANHLFTPAKQIPNICGGNRLDGDATPQQVASNIRAFCHAMVISGQVE